jgi:transcriptional regulator with XRE-family HTH domain
VGNLLEARQALGLKLRELRQGAELSGRELAQRLDWQPSKVSKIENGKQTPSEADVRAWTRETGSEHQAPDLLACVRSLETQYTEWRRLLRDGTRIKQRAALDLEGRTVRLRVFESMAVPGLLQTAEYARHILARAVDLYRVPDDVDEGVRVRMRRQDVLYQPRRRFHFVVAEAALRYRLCPPPVLAGQLDRLLALTSQPHIRLGVLPLAGPVPVAPMHGFWIFDEREVHVETFAAELILTQPQEIAVYARVFDWMARAAVYGAEARALVNRVLREVSPGG